MHKETKMEEKIIQIRLQDGTIVKSMLVGDQALSVWLNELSDEHDLEPGEGYKYLLDSDGVRYKDFVTFKENVIYCLPVARKKRKREESLSELIVAKDFDAAFLKLTETSVQFRETRWRPKMTSAAQSRLKRHRWVTTTFW